MKRIGIIGPESTHAMAFATLLNVQKRHPGLCVTCVYGEEKEKSRETAEKCHIAAVAGAVDEMIGQVDAVMITSRSGSLHEKYAMPFLEKGIPLFIDKPLTEDFAQAQALVREAQSRGVPVMGGSSVKLAEDTLALRGICGEARAESTLFACCLWAPIIMENPYGGFSFYASHLVEIALTLFGYAPVSVSALRHAKGVNAILTYPDIAVSLCFMEGCVQYGAALVTDRGACHRGIDISRCYEKQVDQFAAMLETHTMPQPAFELIQPVRVVSAIRSAYTGGNVVMLP